VPVLLGPPLPRNDRGDEEYEEWCCAILILFKPWRELSDLKSPFESWTAAFEQYSFSKKARNIMKNIHIENECRDARQTYNQLCTTN
ncbi:hypothetical protein JAAARDRAFT_106612, partial [Jaapia argillacea MUCL 33604]